MSAARSQAELVVLRKHAAQLAEARKERVTSVHLIAAVAGAGGPAADLLQQRKLDQDALLKAARSFDEIAPDTITRALTAARDVAKREMGRGGLPTEPNAIHLLIALLADRRSAAYRALEHLSIDLARLRTSAMQIALHVVAERRVPIDAARTRPVPPEPRGSRDPRDLRDLRDLRDARGHAAHESPAPEPRRASLTPAGVTVSLTPPLRPAPNANTNTNANTDSSSNGPASTSANTKRGRAASVSTAPSARATRASEPPRDARDTSDHERPAPTATRVPIVPSAGAGDGPASARKPTGVSVAQRFEVDPVLQPTLRAYGKNLTQLAAQGALGGIVGRHDEIEQTLDALSRRDASSACIVGPIGVGKTSLARGVARRLVDIAAASGRITRLVEVSLAELAAAGRGLLAERVAAMRSEIAASGVPTVLFFDQTHELFGGLYDDAANEVRLGLARGELVLLGATTAEEYRRVIENDLFLARKFTPVELVEPDEADAFLLVREVVAQLGEHHGLVYTDEAAAAAVAWSIRYLPGRALPDKAISVLDLAGARTRRHDERVLADRARAEAAGVAYEAPTPRKSQPPGAGARFGAKPTGRAPAPAPRAFRDEAGPREVGPEEVAVVVAELADIPIARLLETDGDRMLALESILGERVVGHEAPIGRIASVLRKSAAGLRGARPLGTFLLLGSTGVGKTETAKAIAEALFHSADAMTRLDLSEYAEAHAIARLVGAPPGYVGHEAGGQLTEAVRRRPYQVILLDEIDKAHRDVLEAFLQVFDEGRMTDGRGRRVDFTNTVIVLTTNLGAGEASSRKGHVGFASSASSSSSAGPGLANGSSRAAAMLAAARSALPPELYNRLDEVLCFEPLTRLHVARIARMLLTELEASLDDRGVALEVAPEAVDALLDAGGYDPELGARPMRRAIARLVEAPLAELILRGELPSGSTARITTQGSQLVVTSQPPRKPERAARTHELAY